MTILITGATGKLGSKIVENVLARVSPEEVAVSVRDTSKAEGLKVLGVDVRRGDFDDPESLDEAFEGVDKLLIISTDGDNETRIKQHANAVDAAKRSGVAFVAYTSIAQAPESTNIMAPPHVATEKAIKESGLTYALLRNNWYIENEASTIQQVMTGAPWVTSAGDGKVGWATQDDYAEAAAIVLTEGGHENKIYELSGPLYSQQEFVDTLSDVLGNDVVLQDVTDEEYAAGMRQAGLTEPVVDIVVGIQQSIRSGSLDVPDSDFEELLGRPVTPLRDAVKQVVDGLSAGK
ncbi:SDR family oxidoreductase [Paenalkalicoccus suaedae]|uniref:SDR family oxidoreductase n=1 Tax=Paenalkalicoccus suaedae TaxID=2592382 RepID=A0A859FBJ8_9BACI|nr:SDR family oxidoreductase [Paenalkalicoccus suaedae]QKS69914.1 SDR family oxidoreductase [Paenalkalicoccus suaedae]